MGLGRRMRRRNERQASEKLAALLSSATAGDVERMLPGLSALVPEAVDHPLVRLCASLLTDPVSVEKVWIRSGRPDSDYCGAYAHYVQRYRRISLSPAALAAPADERLGTVLHELGHAVEWTYGVDPAMVAHRAEYLSWYAANGAPGREEWATETVSCGLELLAKIFAGNFKNFDAQHASDVLGYLLCAVRA